MSASKDPAEERVSSNGDDEPIEEGELEAAHPPNGDHNGDDQPDFPVPPPEPEAARRSNGDDQPDVPDEA